MIAEWTTAIIGSDPEQKQDRETLYLLIRALQMVDADLQARAAVADRILQNIEAQEREEDLERG